jgi:hypothetical protein
VAALQLLHERWGAGDLSASFAHNGLEQINDDLKSLNFVTMKAIN